MTPGDRAAAQAALNEGRSVYGRLDQIRGPEDAAADILDLWAAAESAMRAMLGGSTLSGQPLVRELRQRGTLNLEQANALASFWDARARVDDVGYKPTLTDVGYARVGYNELTQAVAESAATGAAAAATAAAGAAAGSQFAAPRVPPAPGVPPAAAPRAVPPAVAAVPPLGAAPPRPIAEPVRRPARRLPVPAPLLLGGLALLAIIVIAAIYLTSGGSTYNKEMDTAAGLLSTGRTESARAAFNKIAREHPEESKPHVFLARFARQDGDPSTARQELETAIRLNPADELAQREMGLLLLSENDPQLARNFFLRAVKLDPTDLAAQGYLGCALLRMNRIDEAQSFLTRAGPGAWTSCTAVPPPATPPVTAPR